MIWHLEHRLYREFTEPDVVAHFVVPGEPQSKARARITMRSGKVTAYTPRQTALAEQMIAARFRQASPRYDAIKFDTSAECASTARRSAWTMRDELRRCANAAPARRSSGLPAATGTSTARRAVDLGTRSSTSRCIDPTTATRKDGSPKFRADERKSGTVWLMWQSDEDRARRVDRLRQSDEQGSERVSG